MTIKARVTFAAALSAAIVLGMGLPGACLAQPAAASAEYRLGPGDQVRVTVFGEDGLTGQFSVSASGQLPMPLIGDVPAEGLTPSQLQQSITARLADGYLKNPRVSTEVLTYRPFYILGEVMKPGEYPYASGLTVMSAVATAQGFTYRANTKHVFIKHRDTAQEIDTPLTPMTPIEPGDTIRIGERFF